MKRTDIINILIEKINGNNYLEIGVCSGENFNNIKCKHKVGVDPNVNSPATIHLTSDEFFKTNKENFDVIFIDGLHHSEQVYRDIINSLNVLSPNGYIVCHDMNPEKEEHQIIPFTGGVWTGDCWKAFVSLRQERNDLGMYVVNTDYGCGIIQKGTQESLKINEELNWNNFNINRKKWLNLISIQEFYETFDIKFTLNDLLISFIHNPNNSENNFLLALYYHSIGQTASALSYYLRTAERTDDKLFQYECLIKASMCFDEQGCRSFTVKGLLQHAVSILPKRPEGYFLLSRFYEREQKWHDSYLIASIGIVVSDFNCNSLRTEINYPGKYGILFEKAVSSWHCGLCDESRDLFIDLNKNYELDEIHAQAVDNNLIRLNIKKSQSKLTQYDISDKNKLKFQFENLEIIDKNYSEAYQDMFVLSMLNGKKNGTYLEIGAGDPFYGNNTALLETKFGWKGIALDIDENFVTAHTQQRNHTCLLNDALEVDYKKLLNLRNMPTNIDYLQLDCDPPEITYKILSKIPFETHKFAVITYEHDYYCDETKSFRDKSRKYLQSFGYQLVVDNISPDDEKPFEDWWVHPDLIDNTIINKMLNIDGTTKKAKNYILSGNKFYSDFETDKYLRENFFPDLDYKGIMVEVGAGPPEFINNSKHFRDSGWRTISVEPNPKFVKQHKDTNSEVYQYACSNEEKETTFTINYNNDDWYSQENDGVSFSSLGIRYDNVPEHNTQEVIKVQTIKLNTLLDKIDVSSIDILSIDTEGWELEVMMGFDQEKYLPKVIVLENYQNNLNYEPFMKDRNYIKHSKLGYNEIYVREKLSLECVVLV